MCQELPGRWLIAGREQFEFIYFQFIISALRRWLSSRCASCLYLIVSMIGKQMNAALARLILYPGVIGTAAQFAVHTIAYATGREPGQRAWAGIRRAVCQCLL